VVVEIAFRSAEKTAQRFHRRRAQGVAVMARRGGHPPGAGGEADDEQHSDDDAVFR
jgi:hypothetical protein